MTDETGTGDSARRGDRRGPSRRRGDRRAPTPWWRRPWAYAGYGVIGALLLILADLVVRAGPAGRSIPVGVITTAIGTPLFIWILVRMRRGVAS